MNYIIIIIIIIIIIHTQHNIEWKKGFYCNPSK